MPPVVDDSGANGNGCVKSKSDTEITTSPSSIHKSSSSSNHRLFIEDISCCEASAGDRLWAKCCSIDDTPINIHFLGENFEESALDILTKRSVIMFTVPSLNVDSDTEVELRFATSDDNVTTIPFKYLKRRRRETDDDLFENLLEFATTGDTISLLQPFVSHISKCDGEGNTVLHVAAKNGQSFSLKLLLSVLIPDTLKNEVINTRNSHGLTALHCAIRAGDPDAVHYLMSHGSRIDIGDNHGNTALHYLGDAYNESIFKEVLEPSRGQRFDVNQMNSEGYAPIHVAVRRLKLSLIEMLLEAGALIDFVDAEKKRNALMHAIEMNDFETIQLLIERGSMTNLEDESGETALSLAFRNVNYPVVGLLLDNGADANRRNSKGSWCLADSEDETIQKIINGERPELPKKEAGGLPNDLAVSRSPLFGRSHPHNAPAEDFGRNRVVKKSREEIMNEAETLLNETDMAPRVTRITVSESDEDDQQPGPSTVGGGEGIGRRRTEWDRNPKLSDSVCNLDYLTRIRVSKIFDDQSKWQRLAQQLDCDHMIELIAICSAGDDSSPTMILLDQFEQLDDSSISRLREAMNRMEEEEGVKLIDSRYVY